MRGAVDLKVFGVFVMAALGLEFLVGKLNV